MPRFIVLLRGVNVGKGHRVPMAEFKRLLESLGYTGVKTLLNSGNAVFASSRRSPARHAHSITAGVQATFGVSTPVVVKSADQLSAIVEGNPLGAAASDRSRLLVIVGMDSSALRALEPLLPLAQGKERLVITDVAAYLHCPGGLLESKIGKAVLGRAGKAVTSRNWTTVLKLEALVSDLRRSGAKEPPRLDPVRFHGVPPRRRRSS